MNKLNKSIILLVLCLLIPLFLAEVSSRYLLYKKTPADLIFDKDLIFTCKPNGYIWNQSLNNIGCIGPNLSKEKRTNEVRIFLLGGSTSFSRDYVDAVHKVLSNLYPQKIFSVVSCGKPRYASYNNLINLKKNLLEYSPDIIVCYMGINDCIYNSFHWIGKLPDIGYFDYRSMHHSIFLKLFKYHIVDKQFRITTNWSGKTLRSASIFKSNVSEIINIALANNIKVVLSSFVVSYPTDDSLLRSTIKHNEKRMQHFWGTIESTIYGVDQHNKIMSHLAKKHGLPFAEINTNVISPTSEYFSDICHMTKKGKNRLGEIIGNEIATISLANE